MRYLSAKEIITINQKVLMPGQPFGLRYPAGLASAVARPQQTVAGSDGYPGVFDKAAALIESLVQNHVFTDGNKRTGYVAVVMFLDYNGYTFMLDEEEAVRFTLWIANDKPELGAIAARIRQEATS